MHQKIQSSVRQEVSAIYTYTKELARKTLNNPPVTKLSNSTALAQMQKPDSHAPEGGILQRNVEGNNSREWLDSHRLSRQKRDLFLEFYNMVNMESSFLFLVTELDSYCEPYFKLNYSAINKSEVVNFDRFKKFVAMVRDPEGAHGGQHHTHEGGKGTQYIHDRVVTGGANTASYLPLDTFLTWDSKLMRNHEEIFGAYRDRAADLVELIVGRADNRTQAALRTAATGLSLPAAIRIGGGEILTLTVSSGGAGINAAGGGFSFAVRASISSNQPVPSISITRADALVHGIHGAVQGMKQPEAHTGNLAPVFTINENDIVDNSEDITAGMLKWVTKY